MRFIALHHVLPELAHRETRTFVVARRGMPLPVDSYTFNEHYCADASCDCRRVKFEVVSKAGQALEAVINYGWETPEFYARSMRTTDRKVIADMRGPSLSPDGHGSRRAPAVLEMFRQLMLPDSAYVARLAAHYRAFRKRLADPAPILTIMSVGHNDACPCGSGRKFRLCCGRETSAH